MLRLSDAVRPIGQAVKPVVDLLLRRQRALPQDVPENPATKTPKISPDKIEELDLGKPSKVLKSPESQIKGVLQISESIWKDLGYTASSFRPLSEADKTWYRKLPYNLKEHCAIVPLIGNVSAHEFGERANQRARDLYIVGHKYTIATCDELSKLIGSTPSFEPHYRIILTKIWPGSLGRTDGIKEQIDKAGFQLIHPATAFISMALIRLTPGPVPTRFFEGPNAETSMPNIAANDSISWGRAHIEQLDPKRQRFGIGYGVERNPGVKFKKMSLPSLDTLAT